jgi:hypothetical protein
MTWIPVKMPPMTNALAASVDEALDAEDEAAAYRLWNDLQSERQSRVASLTSEADLVDVRAITDAQNRIAGTLSSRRDFDARLAAVAADDPSRELPPKQPKPPERPKAVLRRVRY